MIYMTNNSKHCSKKGIKNEISKIKKPSVIKGGYDEFRKFQKQKNRMGYC